MTTTTTTTKTSLAQLPPYQSSKPIPAFFFAHGSPSLLKEANMSLGPGFEGSHIGPQADFLRQFGPYLIETYRPKAIVVISAHWETEPRQKIQIMDNEDDWQADNLYYDYYGFPDACYSVKFKSRGDHAVSQRISEVLNQNEIPNELVKNERGLDHGCFVPFKLMFGDACSIPIIEMSQYVDHQANIDLGLALSALRKEGILILSGGLTVHTFQDMSAFSPQTAKQGYKDFSDTLTRAVSVQDAVARDVAIKEAMTHEYFRKAHPRIEHFTPLAVAVGAGSTGGSQVVSDLYGAMSVAFGLE